MFHGRSSRQRADVAGACALGALATAFGTGLAHGVAWLPAGVALGLYGAVALGVWRGRSALPPGRGFGLANAVTLARAVIVAVLAGLVVAPPAVLPLWPVLVAGLGLALDGADGWLARRNGTASAFGARFDMEVDALFTLVLGLVLWRGGIVGPWILAAGLLRYAFVAAGALWPVLAAPLPERRRRKAVFVAQALVLIALLAPGLPPALAGPAAASALAVLVWSFAVDVVWLVRQSAPARPSASPVPAPEKEGVA